MVDQRPKIIAFLFFILSGMAKQWTLAIWVTRNITQTF